MWDWIILIALAVVVFWPQIIEFIQEVILPWVRTNCAPDTIAAIESLVVWLDNRITLFRNAVINAWRSFTQTLYGARTEFIKTSSVTATEKRTVVFDRNGIMVMKTIEREIRYDELPPEIRSEMIRRSVNSAVINDKDVIRARVKEKAADDGLGVIDVSL